MLSTNLNLLLMNDFLKSDLRAYDSTPDSLRPSSDIELFMSEMQISLNKDFKSSTLGSAHEMFDV